MKLKKNKNETMAYIEQNVPMRRFGSIADVVNCVVYLSSEHSTFIPQLTSMVAS